MAVLVTGGARSGKSAFAERYAARCAGRGIYIATSQPLDAEMAERARKHRESRAAAGFPWETIEEPMHAAALLDRLAADPANALRPPAVLLDCLTLWLTNVMLAAEDEDRGAEADARADAAIERAIDELAGAVDRFPHPLVLVTNEVGSGIVPEYPLGRRFRDAAGRLNQRMAAACERVFLVVAGIPVDLKAIAFNPEEM